MPRPAGHDEQRIVAVAGAVPTRSGALHALEPGQALRYLRGHGIAVSAASWANPRQCRPLSPAHAQLEAKPRSDYERKAERILALPRATRKRRRDQLRREGAGEPLPHAGTQLGAAWTAERLRATYNRRHGVRYLVAALDVYANYLRAGSGQPGRRLTLVFMQQIRLAYPRRLRLYWIQDNLSCHWTPAIRAWRPQQRRAVTTRPACPAPTNRARSRLR